MSAFRLMAAAVALSLHIAFAAAAEAPPGASSCTGCHAAHAGVDSPIPRLAGRVPAEMLAQMQAYRTGQLQGTVMERIARGFTDDEVRAIAAWYATQQ